MLYVLGLYWFTELPVLRVGARVLFKVAFSCGGWFVCFVDCLGFVVCMGICLIVLLLGVSLPLD